MVYAFSRDGAMPLSSLWHKVNNQEVPINAVWLSAIISFCMALTVFYFHYFEFIAFAVLSELLAKNFPHHNGPIEFVLVPSNNISLFCLLQIQEIWLSYYKCAYEIFLKS